MSWSRQSAPIRIGGVLVDECWNRELYLEVLGGDESVSPSPAPADPDQFGNLDRMNQRIRKNAKTTMITTSVTPTTALIGIWDSGLSFEAAICPILRSCFLASAIRSGVGAVPAASAQVPSYAIPGSGVMFLSPLRPESMSPFSWATVSAVPNISDRAIATTSTIYSFYSARVN